MKLKFSNLTGEQRNQVREFYHDTLVEEKGKKNKTIVLNQMSFRVNPKDGNVIFHKDF